MSFRGKFPPNINRPPFQPFGMKQFTPQPRPYVNRVLFNDAPIDQSIISKLFLLIQEDNFKKLQEFINENGITTNSMIDDNGQTVVHVITSSQNLSIVTKKQLLKYLKTIGYYCIASKFSVNNADYDSCFINTKIISQINY